MLPAEQALRMYEFMDWADDNYSNNTRFHAWELAYLRLERYI